TRAIRSVRSKAGRLIGQEVSDRREGKRAWSIGKAVRVLAAELASKLNRMISAYPSCSVVCNCDIIPTALREAADSAEGKVAGYGNLWQPDGSSNTAVDAESGGAVSVVGRENDVDAIEAKPRFIH